MQTGQEQQNAGTIAEAAIQTAQPGTTAAPGAATPAASSTPAAAEQVGEGGALPVNTSFVDDDAELAKLEAEQARLAQEAGATAAGAAPGTPAGSAAAAPASAPAAGAPASEAGSAGTSTGTAAAQAASANSQTSAMIAMRRKIAEEREGRLRAEGAAAALQSVARTAVQGQVAGDAAQAAEPAAPTFEEQRAQLDKDVIALATDFEEGRLTATQWKTKEMELNRQRDELVLQQAAELNQGAPVNNGNDLGLEQHLTRLVGAFPILNQLSENDLKPFYELAYRQAALRGEVIPDTAQGTVILRERMAALAEEFYDAPAAARRKAAQAAGGQPPNAGAGNAGGAPAAGSRPTAAQREAKLQQAAGAPPDISSIGTGSQVGELTEASVEARLKGMNDDQAIRFLDANPGFVSKVMGGKTQRN